VREAREYLAGVCGVMADLIDRHTPPRLEPKPPGEYFDVLISSIIGQQLSVKAADTIEARVRAVVSPLTPESLANTPGELLRAQGLSHSKISYVQGIAEAFRSGAVDPDRLSEGSEHEVVETLTTLRGVGPWTAEMFLIFAMGRPDVWSPGDLGLRKAVWSLFGEESDPVEVSERWRPYRSYAALYLWEYSDNAPASAAHP